VAAADEPCSAAATRTSSSVPNMLTSSVFILFLEPLMSG
jgi:hypothetical protein